MSAYESHPAHCKPESSPEHYSHPHSRPVLAWEQVWATPGAKVLREVVVVAVVAAGVVEVGPVESL